MCSTHEMNRASIDEEVVAAATTMTAIMMSTGRGGAVVVARRSVPPPPPSRRSRVTAAVASAAAALVAMRNRNSSRRVAPVNVDVAAQAAEAVDNIEAEENSSSAGRHAKPTRRWGRIRLRMPQRSAAVAPAAEEPTILPTSSSPEPRPALRICIRLRPQRAAAAAAAAIPEVATAVDADDSASRTDTDAATSASTKPAPEARVEQESTSTSILRPKAAGAAADVRVAVTVNQAVVAVVAASRHVLEASNFKGSEDDKGADAKRPAHDDDAVSSPSHSEASSLAVDKSDNVKVTGACDGDGQDSNRDADDDDDFSDLPPLEEEPAGLESPQSVLADTSVDLDVTTLPPSKVQEAFVELSTHEREDFHETTRVWSKKELLDWKRRVQESIAERRRSRLRRRPGTPYAGAPVPRRRRPGV